MDFNHIWFEGRCKITLLFGTNKYMMTRTFSAIKNQVLYLSINGVSVLD